MPDTPAISAHHIKVRTAGDPEGVPLRYFDENTQEWLHTPIVMLPGGTLVHDMKIVHKENSKATNLAPHVMAKTTPARKKDPQEKERLDIKIRRSAPTLREEQPTRDSTHHCQPLPALPSGTDNPLWTVLDNTRFPPATRLAALWRKADRAARDQNMPLPEDTYLFDTLTGALDLFSMAMKGLQPGRVESATQHLTAVLNLAEAHVAAHVRHVAQACLDQLTARQRALASMPV